MQYIALILSFYYFSLERYFILCVFDKLSVVSDKAKGIGGGQTEDRQGQTEGRQRTYKHKANEEWRPERATGDRQKRQNGDQKTDRMETE